MVQSKNIEKISSLGKNNTIESIIRGNPEAGLNLEDYKKYLHVRLTKEEEKLFLEKALSTETIEKLAAFQLSYEKTKFEEQKSKYTEASNAIKEGDIEREKAAIEAGKKADEQLEYLHDSPIGDGEKATLTTLDKANEAVKKGEKLSFFVSIRKSLEDVAKEGGFLGGIANFFLLFFKLFDKIFPKNKAIEEGQKIIETKLNPVESDKVKSTAKNTIKEYFGPYLQPSDEAKIFTAIEGLSPQQIFNLHKKISAGEKISISDISKELPGLLDNILSPENYEKIKENIIESVTRSLKESIKKIYGVDLDLKPEKLKALQKLITDNLNISKDNILSINNIIENKEFTYKDLAPIGGEVLLNTSKLLIGIISKGILPVSAIAMEFASKGKDMIMLSASALGLSGETSFSSLHETISKLSEAEKAIFIGLLYRKGGLFLSILGNTSEFILRMGIGAFSETSFSNFNALTASMTGNLEKQANNFYKLAELLNGYEPGSKKVLNSIMNNVKAIGNNYKALDILEKTSKLPLDDAGKIQKVWNEFNKHNIPITIAKDFTGNFGDLIKEIGKNVPKSFNQSISIGEWAAKYGFGFEADVFRLNGKLEKISKAQRALFEPSILSKGLGKITELLHIGEVGKLGNRLTLHFATKTDAIKGISGLNILANRFPELAKGIFEKLPIITVAGLAATGEEPFFESLKKQSLYLLPIIGPILIIGNTGWDFKNGYPMPIDPVNAGIGAALLTLDGYILAKEFTKNGLSAAGKYLIKPLTDTYGIVKGTGDIIYTGGKAIMRGKGISSAFKTAIEKSKVIKNNKVRTIAIIALAGYIGITQFTKDEMKEIVGKDGVLDREKLAKKASKLTDEEKLTCAKYILEETWGKDQMTDINIKIKDSTLYITSKNPKVQSDWFIDSDFISELQLTYSQENFKYLG